jgi:biotin carboxyl carrier protein
MAHAYTPGLKVTSHMAYSVKRILPIKGDVLVSAGDQVQADQVVAETSMPGDIYPMNLANILAVPPSDVAECLLKKEGDRVEQDEPIAKTQGMFGMMKKTILSKYEGTVETISSVTGQVILRGAPIPVQVKAYVTGKVVEVLDGEGCVIEADCSYMQGIFGVGGETCGPIRMVGSAHDEPLEASSISEDMSGTIVVGGGRMTAAAIKKARDVGAVAIVAGGIDDQDLRDFLGYDLGVAITGSEKLGITLVITEGFGDIAMARQTWGLLSSMEGREASINGATQIRAGVMRPEIIVPHGDAAPPTTSDKVFIEEGLLVEGRPVRIIRDPYFGVIGTVAGLPSEPQVLDSGSKARVLEVKLDSGESVVIPRANVELIED